VALTTSGRVLAWGTNGSGQLGLGHTNSMNIPQTVGGPLLLHPEARINSLACGYGHILALSDQGLLYGWGANSNGEVGNGTVNSELTPTLITKGFGSLKVLFVTCGSNHSFCITERPDVSLQDNKSSSSASESYSSSLSSIACGQVFAWGYNGSGQLGFGDSTNRSSPTLFNLAFMNPKSTPSSVGFSISPAIAAAAALLNPPGKKKKKDKEDSKESKDSKEKKDPVVEDLDNIISITCCYNSSFILTSKGKMYSCGSNGNGELGLGDSSNRNTFTMMPFWGEQKLFVEQIAAHPSLYMCVASTRPISDPTSTSTYSSESSKQLSSYECRRQIFTWGNVGALSVKVMVPMATSANDLDEVFMTFPEQPFTYQLVRAVSPSALPESGVSEESALRKSLVLAFNNPEFSDFTFIVDGKEIAVNSSIISIRSEYLHAMLKGPWKGIKEKRVELTEYGYEVYLTYLKYLYTDKLEGVDPGLAVQILDLATGYRETRLVCLCEHIIKSSINIYNAADLLALALRYNAIILKDYCMEFIMENLTGFISSPNFSKIPDSFLKEVLARAAAAGKFTC